jgi:simple sugar transport system substrate-binding protein
MGKEEKKVDRRDYLKYTGAAIGGLVVGGALGYVLKPAEVVEKTITAPGVEKTVTVTKPSEVIKEITVRGKTPFSDLVIVSLVGAKGDPFADRLAKGASEAGEILGCDVRNVYCGWGPEEVKKGFKDALAIGPDGIVTIGHGPWDVTHDCFEEAAERGIVVTIRNVDIPQARERYQRYGCGYVGADLYKWAWGAAKEAIKRGFVKPGERAAVISGCWGEPVREDCDTGVEDGLKDSGVIVDRIVADEIIYSKPEETIPYLVGYYSKHPDVKYIFLDTKGGVARKFCEAVGLKPGEIKMATYNIEPSIIEEIKEGYLEYSCEQQPYYQGFLPIFQICATKKYGLAGLVMYTHENAILDATNADLVAKLTKDLYR